MSKYVSKWQRVKPNFPRKRLNTTPPLQVTGLPGDDSEDSNQFGYTNLREDTMVDRPYVTMQPASTPVAQAFGNGTYTNSPATLNLED